MQGAGKGTPDAWDNKLVASLTQALGARNTIRYPRMPDEANPAPAAWKKVIDREVRRLGNGAILVGHSVGAAVLIDYLADANGHGKLGGVFLIAGPFIGDGGWPSDELRPTRKAASALPLGVPIHLYHGSADETVPFAHLAMFAKALPAAKIRSLKGRNHQLNEDLSEVARDIRRLGLARAVTRPCVIDPITSVHGAGRHTPPRAGVSRT